LFGRLRHSVTFAPIRIVKMDPDCLSSRSFVEHIHVSTTFTRMCSSNVLPSSRSFIEHVLASTMLTRMCSPNVLSIESKLIRTHSCFHNVHKNVFFQHVFRFINIVFDPTFQRHLHPLQHCIRRFGFFYYTATRVFVQHCNTTLKKYNSPIKMWRGLFEHAPFRILRVLYWY